MSRVGRARHSFCCMHRGKKCNSKKWQRQVVAMLGRCGGGMLQRMSLPQELPFCCLSVAFLLPFCSVLV
jgi:hypothetical protein